MWQITCSPRLVLSPYKLLREANAPLYLYKPRPAHIKLGETILVVTFVLHSIFALLIALSRMYASPPTSCLLNLISLILAAGLRVVGAAMPSVDRELPLAQVANTLADLDALANLP